MVSHHHLSCLTPYATSFEQRQQLLEKEKRNHANREPLSSSSSSLVRSTFSVKLVDAETLQPFKDVTADGKTYVEIQPDQEYFVCIQAISKNAPRFKADIIVDGKSLGYRYRASSGAGGPKFLGLRSVRNGKNQLHALKFARASSKKRYNDGTIHTVSTATSHNNNEDDEMTVRADFHVVDEEWEEKKHTTQDADISWSNSDAERSTADGDNASACSSVYSTVGNIETRGPSVSKRVFKTGRFLGSIKLHYRTSSEIAELQTLAQTLAPSPSWTSRSEKCSIAKRGRMHFNPRRGKGRSGGC